MPRSKRQIGNDREGVVKPLLTLARLLAREAASELIVSTAPTGRNISASSSKDQSDDQ
jgi:hypothetical protein